MKKKNRTEILFFIVGVVLSILMLKTLRLHTDNTQLMDKSLRLLLDGEWTHFGNMATKVGNIPGTFLTLITSAPMAIFFSAWSAGLIVLLFHCAGYFFLRKSLLLIYEDRASQISLSLILLSLIFWLNPWRVEQVELYNPGFLFLFAGLHLWTALKMSSKNFWMTFWHVLAVGFCFQVHFSFLIIGLVSLFLFLRRQIVVSWRGFAFGTVVVLTSLIPFLLTRFFADGTLHSQQIQNLDFSKSDAFLGRNFVLVYPVIKAILYFFRMGSTYFGRHVFSEIQFEWIDNEFFRALFFYGFHGLKYIVTLATLLLSFYLIGTFLKAQFQQKIWKLTVLNVEPKNRFNNYFFYLFVSAVVAAGLSPVEFNHWHLVICFPVISIFMIVQLLKFERVLRHQKKIIWCLATLFITWSVFMAGGSRSHEFKLDYQAQFVEHYKNKYETLDDSLGHSILWQKMKVLLFNND